MNARIHIHTHIHTYVHTDRHTYAVCAYTHTYTCTNVLHVHICIRIHVHVDVDVYVYVNENVYMHTVDKTPGADSLFAWVAHYGGRRSVKRTEPPIAVVLAWTLLPLQPCARHAHSARADQRSQNSERMRRMSQLPFAKTSMRTLKPRFSKRMKDDVPGSPAFWLSILPLLTTTCTLPILIFAAVAGRIPQQRVWNEGTMQCARSTKSTLRSTFQRT